MFVHLTLNAVHLSCAWCTETFRVGLVWRNVLFPGHKYARKTWTLSKCPGNCLYTLYSNRNRLWFRAWTFSKAHITSWNYTTSQEVRDEIDLISWINWWTPYKLRDGSLQLNSPFIWGSHTVIVGRAVMCFLNCSRKSQLDQAESVISFWLQPGEWLNPFRPEYNTRAPTIETSRICQVKYLQRKPRLHGQYLERQWYDQ